MNAHFANMEALSILIQNIAEVTCIAKVKDFEF